MAVLKVIHRKNAGSNQYIDTPKYHDENSLFDVISYCCNPAKAKSKLIGGFGISIPNAAEQMDGLARSYGKADGIRLRHMVLSFEPGERIVPEFAFQIAYQIAWYYGCKYQIVFAVHQDKPHLHIHFVMNTVSFVDGHKYAGKKEDYYAFLQHIRLILAVYGIDLTSI